MKALSVIVGLNLLQALRVIQYVLILGVRWFIAKKDELIILVEERVVFRLQLCKKDGLILDLI